MNKNLRKEGKIMTKFQLQIATKEIILLDKEDVKILTGWGENTINKLFANNKAFPAIRIGKKYQVELGALKEYLKNRRVSE